jgi:hypothetical protein
MSDRPKPWPHHAAWARDDSSELADEIYRQLALLIESYFLIDETAKMQIIALAMKKAQTICRKLEGVGAQTRP